MSLDGPVLLGEGDPGWINQLDAVLAATRDAESRVDRALELCREWGPAAPQPGDGHTRELWEMLATVASADLTVARVLEPHLDARAILAQAGSRTEQPTTWGVFAAEVPGTAVVAEQRDDGWFLSGSKAWCSLAGRLDCALITARDADDSRLLFAVDLRQGGVAAQSGSWVARGLSDVTSESVELEDVPAIPVGGPGWYLVRDGFEWGGMGVAAVWYGAMVGLGRRLHASVKSSQPDPIPLMLLGAVDLQLHTCRAVLAEAAADVDGRRRNQKLLAQRVRSVVSAAAERVISIVGHGLGPAPLALEEEHARRVADLTLYLRQDHAEKDVARVGAQLLTLEGSPW